MADETFMETKREEIDGYAYASGPCCQIVFDSHTSDDDHLGGKATHDTQPLYRCRTYLRDLIPKEWLDKKGKILVDRTVTTTGEVVAVSVAFIPG